MKNIRKVQTKCKLLNVFINNSHQIFKGIIFDKCLYATATATEHIKYNVYLPELDIITNYKSNTLIINNECIFKIYVFHNESQLKKKIKLLLINTTIDSCI